MEIFGTRKVVLRAILLAFFGFMILSCGGHEKNTNQKKKADGKKIFETYCVSCHGLDGKMGVGGAKDLSVSMLPLEEKIAIITYGKNAMTAFSNALNQEEITAVAVYLEKLKK